MNSETNSPFSILHCPKGALILHSPLIKPGYKQTEVGVIPEDWEVKQLGNLATLKSGESITAERIDDCSEFPCYGGNGLRGFTKTHTHEGNYALIGRQGALCGNVINVSGKFFASEHALVVTPKENVAIQWLSYILADANLNKYSESSAQPGLSATKLFMLEFNTPPTIEEQRAIATALSDMDALLDGLDPPDR